MGKTKRIITALMSLIMMLTITKISVLAAPDYNFGCSVPTMYAFAKATDTDKLITPNPMMQNVRRNKDAAVFPPPYGIFSGEIPTDPVSPYHNNLPESGFVPVDQDLPAIAGGGYVIGSGDYAIENENNVIGGDHYAFGSGGYALGDGYYAFGSGGYSLGGGYNAIGGNSIPSGFLPSTTQITMLNTLPWYYEDGSIGTLYVSHTDKTIKVYESESSDNLKIGAGHISATSVWDDNIALAGHNRGNSAYFSFVKDLKTGDTLTYTTMYGERIYKVTSKTQVDEWDISSLSSAKENILTLITCVEDIPELRYCVVASEVK
jgi:LPXTG-site transpeptidase (sortase) family protein